MPRAISHMLALALALTPAIASAAQCAIVRASGELGVGAEVLK